VLEERIASGAVLTDEEVLRLHAQYILSRDVQTVERIQQRLLGLLQETSQRVPGTGTCIGPMPPSMRRNGRAAIECLAKVARTPARARMTAYQQPDSEHGEVTLERVADRPIE
jgi:hypothetical protein